MKIAALALGAALAFASCGAHDGALFYEPLLRPEQVWMHLEGAKEDGAWVTPVATDSLFRARYATAERCTGLSGAIERVQLYLAEALIPTDSVGIWWGGVAVGDKIILVRGDTGSTLQHEAVHHLLHTKGWRPRENTMAAKHPRPPFGLCTGD